MGTLNGIRSDLTKESDGVWVNFGDVKNPIRLKIARSRNPLFRGGVERITKEARRKNPNVTGATLFQNDADAKKKMAPLLAKYILIDWDNLTDSNDEKIPHSAEKATELLLDPTLEDFYIFILDIMNNADLFRQSDVADDAKK